MILKYANRQLPIFSKREIDKAKSTLRVAYALCSRNLIGPKKCSTNQIFNQTPIKRL